MGLLSSLVSLVYVTAGSAKLVNINKDVYGHMTAGFKDFAAVFPLRSMGCKPEPMAYMQIVGLAEVVLGVMLLVGSPGVRRFSAVCLMVIMAGATHTLVTLDKINEAILPGVMFFVLGLIAFQSSSKVKRD